MNPDKTPVQPRLTQDLLERAEPLIEVRAADPEVRASGMPARTVVSRLAIARGLRDLERQYRLPGLVDRWHAYGIEAQVVMIPRTGG